MKQFIMKGGGYVAIVTAPDLATAVAIVAELFNVAGLGVPDMEAMNFDPTQLGGVLIGPEGAIGGGDLDPSRN